MEAMTDSQREIGEPAQHLVQHKDSSYGVARLLAHDTRNWLTVLQMYCDLLQTWGASDERYPDWINGLAAAVQRGQGLVASLLDTVQSCEDRSTDSERDTSSELTDFRQRKASRRTTRASTLDLVAAVACRLPMLQHLAGSKVHVSVEIETETVRAALAERDFDRILQNLAVNAFEAMPRGGELRIALSALHVERPDANERSCNMVLLRVTDTGTGISPSLLPCIFQPGVSSKTLTVPDRKEHGLGLTVVRDLVLAAGGCVRVRAHGGRGTCFEIELPSAHVLSPPTQLAPARSSGRQRRLPPDHAARLAPPGHTDTAEVADRHAAHRALGRLGPPHENTGREAVHGSPRPKHGPRKKA